MNDKEILLLIEWLARATAMWSGGANSGAVYTSAEWRLALMEIAQKAALLAEKETP